MFYDRKIKYLDYLENKERCKGAGFVKIEVREETCNVAIQVSGLPGRDLCEKEVLLSDGQKEERLGTIKLAGGKGSLILPGLHRRHIGQTGIGYDNLAGIRIPLGTNREIYCAWKGRIPETANNHKEGMSNDKTNAAGTTVNTDTDGALPKKITVAATMPAATIPAATIPAAEMPTVTIPAAATSTVAMPDSTMPVAASPKAAMPTAGEDSAAYASLTKVRSEAAKKDRPKKQPVKLQENKWQQLSFLYPHIKPFHDDRDYLSIGPADFVVLPEKYYRMANNSFLLHGYYNYEHLILTQVEQRGKIIYYIGVPGNFYDREKQVAVMFGFESFECKEEPAKQGDFGYYMMRLEL